MNIALRILIALLCCSLAGALGWQLGRPAALAGRAAPAEAGEALEQKVLGSLDDDDTLSRRISAADPFGLTRNAPLAAQPGAAAASAGGDLITWRLGALVVRGPERYLVLTAAGQKPLKLNVGDKLPDGDKVKAIEPTHAVIQGARGKTRTIYLTEP
ncbi:hypothetical protein [Pelomonas sp. BJYL3]|uniref:hypothetical protein n=1 Tax=Pelomonas sp. BJYL3 TaxID=2976697 RepID=UPI0022B329B1|nr:hypothetical protein [Pelomonas sp. BJYL3]